MDLNWYFSGVRVRNTSFKLYMGYIFLSKVNWRGIGGCRQILNWYSLAWVSINMGGCKSPPKIGMWGTLIGNILFKSSYWAPGRRFQIDLHWLGNQLT